VPRGALHGIPFGVNVDGFPTRCNRVSRVDAPSAGSDADIVRRFKAQGAIFLGKLHTTEMALLRPPPTFNPWNRTHTPDGSPSGSAAAVAAGMVPACDRHADWCLLESAGRFLWCCRFQTEQRGDVFVGCCSAGTVVRYLRHHRGDRGRRLRGASSDPPGLLGAHATARDPTAKLDIVLPIDPLFDDLSADGQRAYGATVDALRSAGHRLSRQTLPVALGTVDTMPTLLFMYEVARAHQGLLAFAPGAIAESLIDAIGQGLKITTDDDLHTCWQLAQAASAFFEGASSADAYLWPAAPGTAPQGLAWTGDWRFISPWTALGGPIVSMPTGLGDNGLPLGCLLYGRPGDDANFADVAARIAADGEVALPPKLH
jgi:aspartyl-tRNA(Asn)/glutamyl-tRNA(Gln) amidotransferase subunit A